MMYFVGHDVSIDGVATKNEDDLEIKALKAGSTGATIYGLDRSNSTTQAGKKIAEFVESEKPENLVLVLGDVDFREHMTKHLGSGFDEYFKSLMQKYLAYIEDKLKKNAGKIALAQMVPFTERFYRDKFSDDQKNSILWFLYGEFNSRLASFALKNGMQTISLSELADSHSFLADDFVRQNSHASEVHANPEKAFPLVVKELRRVFGP